MGAKVTSTGMRVLTIPQDMLPRGLRDRTPKATPKASPSTAAPTPEGATALTHADQADQANQVDQVDQADAIMMASSAPNPIEDLICLAQGSPLVVLDGVPLKKRLTDIERSLIEQALEQADGNVSKTARILSVQRTTLIEKINKYDLKCKPEVDAQDQAG